YQWFNCLQRYTTAKQLRGKKALLCSTGTARQLQLDEQPAIMPNRTKVVAVAYGRR
ncbi:hypothetical protein Tco_0602841, partial [Tanacetum coccineum]